MTLLFLAAAATARPALPGLGARPLPPSANEDKAAEPLCNGPGPCMSRSREKEDVPRDQLQGTTVIYQSIVVTTTPSTSEYHILNLVDSYIHAGSPGGTSYTFRIKYRYI